MRGLENLCDIYNGEFGYNNSSLHLYRIEVSDNQRFIKNMKNVGIMCGIHYNALHLNPIYNGDKYFECPKSKKIQTKTVSLPMNEKLSHSSIEFIVDKVKEML